MSRETNYINQEFIKKWGYLFFARLFPILVLFIITIFYSRKLSFETYGTFQSVWMYSNILSVIMSFGLTTVMLSTNQSILNAFIRAHQITIFKSYAFIIIVTIIGFYLAGKNLSNSTILLVIIYTIIQIFTVIKENIVLKQGKEERLFYINIGYSLLFLSWHLYLLYFNYDLNKLIGGVIVFTILKQAFLGIEFWGTNHLLSSEPLNTDLGKHWVFTGINDIVGVLSKWIDKLFLIYLISPADFAIFFNGSFEIPLFGLLITVAGNVLMVEVSKKIRDTENVIAIFHKNYRLLSTIVFPLFLFLLFNTRELFGVLFNHKYDASIPIFIISLFVLPLRINNYGALLQCYSKGNTVMAGSIVDIVLVLTLMVILYPIMSTRGVALAVILGTYAQILYYLIRSSRIIKISFWKLLPDKEVMIHFVLLTFLFLIIYYLPIKLEPIVKTIIGMIITLLSIFTGLYRFSNTSSKLIHGNPS